MAIGIPGIDEEIFNNLFDNDTGLFTAVLQSFIGTIPATLTRLGNVSRETLPDYALCIHGIKGACATICAEEARKTAQRLEMMANNGDLSGILAENEAFLKNLRDILDNIQNWLKKQ